MYFFLNGFEGTFVLCGKKRCFPMLIEIAFFLRDNACSVTGSALSAGNKKCPADLASLNHFVRFR